MENNDYICNDKRAVEITDKIYSMTDEEAEKWLHELEEEKEKTERNKD